MTHATHFTTRRRFIAAMGFGGVSLYGLWAAYGAAPGPLALLGLEHDAHAEPAAGGGHGGHGAATAGPTADEFNRLTADFIERYRLPDGTVHPRILALAQPTADEHGGHGGGMTMDHGTMDSGMMNHGAMDHGMMAQGTAEHGTSDHGTSDHGTSDHGTSDHGTSDHGTSDHGTSDHGTAAAGITAIDSAAHGGADHADEGTHADAALDVYLSAGMWYYLPAKLRLDAGRNYRFKMMATDVSHGASIQFGRGGRMVRLRPGRVSEVEMSFREPGSYLVYCTVYCGPAHDIMQATIEVV